MFISKLIKKIEFLLSDRKHYVDILRRGGVTIGEGCYIEKDTLFGSEPYLIKLGNNVRISSGVKFVTHDGGMWALRKQGICQDGDIFGRIEIKDGTHVGWNVIIMPNVTIGHNCIIGCGAIVTKDIPDNSVAVGIPARVIEDLDSYYKKNKNKIVMTHNMSAAEKKKYLEQNNLINSK